jgi:hypothetical protein
VVVEKLNCCVITRGALSIFSPDWRATIKLLDLSDGSRPIRANQYIKHVCSRDQSIHY